MFYFGGFLSANKLSLRFYELVFLKRSKGGQRPTGRSVFNFFFLKLAVLIRTPTIFYILFFHDEK